MVEQLHSVRGAGSSPVRYVKCMSKGEIDVTHFSDK